MCHSSVICKSWMNIFLFWRIHHFCQGLPERDWYDTLSQGYNKSEINNMYLFFKFFSTFFIFFILQSAPVQVSAPVFQPLHPLPCLQFRVERVNIEHSVPMYAPELVTTVSSLSQPSDNLLHHCYAHLYLKVSITLFFSAVPIHSRKGCISLIQSPTGIKKTKQKQR